MVLIPIEQRPALWQEHLGIRLRYEYSTMERNLLSFSTPPSSIQQQTFSLGGIITFTFSFFSVKNVIVQDLKENLKR